MSAEHSVAHEFYESALCWLGRPQEAYRLLNEAVFPSVSTWVRGDTEQRSMNAWQSHELRTFLFPVVGLGEEETVMLPCEALLLCGLGSYYNPCDVGVLVFVQRPQERLSQLMQRVRQSEAWVNRSPEVMMGNEHVSLMKKGRDYINTKYIVWLCSLPPVAQETLIKQGLSLIRLSPEETFFPMPISSG
ncbi:MAG: hypothetical protein OHK0012_09050 [Synechococcales cyanobacterium]